jgi:hypothetical protein
MAQLGWMDRRLESRRSTAEPVNIHLINGTGKMVVTGIIADFSRRGLCIVCRTDLPVSSQVLVEYRGSFLIGQVRNARPENGGYRVGLCLEPNRANTSVLQDLADHTTEVKPDVA